MASLGYGAVGMTRGDFAAVDLRCEDLIDPIGIDSVKPRLSWRMVSAAQGAAQSAYQLLCATDPRLLKEGSADVWDTGKVATNASRFITYGGHEINRGMPCYWMVRIWNEDKQASAWSKPAMWSYAGLASNTDWQAKWITDNTSSPWLRQTIELKSKPVRAYIYCNILGYFQLFVNGRRVGEDEFAPHVSQFNKRTFCVTYDVTDLLKAGKNSIGFWLGRGWSGKTDTSGWNGLPGPAVRAQLEVVAAGSEMTRLITDENWRAKPSCMSHQGGWNWNNFGGELYDATQDQPDWADSGFDDAAWPKAKLGNVADIPVSSEMLQRSEVIEVITPIKVTDLKEPGAGGSWLVDMGKAMTGTFEITFPKGAKGQRVSMQFGDSPNAQNSFRQSSEYICRGAGVEIFRNRFNYASFQYVRITGAPAGAITPNNIKGYFIATKLPKASTFECSNATLNGIYKMMEHTLRCLMLGGYQVDCHSRERQGYGGDGQSSLDTTLNFFRADAFYRKWTRDWVDQQSSDGGLTYTSPASGHGGGPFWCGFLTAATLKHYQHYGDITTVERNYPAIRKWLELAQSKTIDNLQQKFCGGGYLGDWASPAGTNDQRNADVFIQAYMSYVLNQGAHLADVLGKVNDARTFRQWAADRGAATHRKCYDVQNKRYGSGDQVTYILPLAGGVVPADLREAVFAGFEQTLQEKNQGHLSTGLSGTYMMVQYLQSIGRDDLIYTFASKNTYPSWGKMLASGATATWELWDGGGTRIHNCYNNIGSWFMEGLAGIRPDPATPGFKNAIIKPAFIKDLSYVNGSHDTVYGTIRSGWRRDGDIVTLAVRIPANSTATISVPAPVGSVVMVNGRKVKEAEHVRFLRLEGDRVVLSVEAGSYELVWCETPAH